MAGHITKRKRGGKIRWRARYPDPTRGGKKEIERIFGTRREAERFLREQQVAVQRGTHINPADTQRQFSYLADAWRATWIDLEPKTAAGYESILNRHVLPRWADAKVGAISAEVVQKWINDLAASGRNPKTVSNVYGVLRAVLNVAVERNYIPANPCAVVRLPRRAGHQRVQLFLTAQEVEALAEAITPRYRLLVYAAAYTGLRAGELHALRRRDVDLLHRKLRVSRALKDINTSSPNIPDESKGLIFGPTKTGASRSVGLPRFLADMLADHIDPLGPDDLVFTSREGEPIRQTNFMRRHFKPAVRAALPAEKHRLRFHDLRHTCAALLIAADAHPKAIQEHLGHRDIQTTFNVYGHLLPSAQEALAAALDTAYEGSAEGEDIPRIGKG
jgi:integrase